MKKYDDSFFLLNIVDALSDILFYTSCSEEEFLIEIMRQDAVARKFENLGESVKNLSSQFCNEHPQIPWLSDLGALTDDLEQFLERKIAVFPLTSLKDYSSGDRISKEMVLL